MEFIKGIFSPPPDQNVAYIVGASVITTFAVMSVSRLALQGKQRKIIRSPRDTVLPKLTEAEVATLPYPPDILPGGRDVDSPYGTIRVYEWGPENGRKVLFIHGITTTCISLGAVAHGLVDRGCRVMLLDLWGRGYSDSCADLEHDDRLYTTEMLIALTSSPLAWTGGPNGGFSLVGYSLGGGIAASFAAYFPGLIRSLVLIAPAGLIRPERMSSRNRFLYSVGLVPEAVVNWIVKRRLSAGPMYKDENRAADGVGDEKATVGSVVTAEVEGPAATTTPSKTTPPLSRSHPTLTVEESVSWQVANHTGFPHSFMSSIRFAPLSDQQSVWRRLRLLAPNTDQKTSSNDKSLPNTPEESNKTSQKILIFAGSRDPIIVADELRPDVEALLGADAIEWRLVQGAAHDFPIGEADVIVDGISKFWGF